MKLQPVLQHLSLGSVACCENLTFAPILGPDGVSTDYLLPDEALQTGYFHVRESGKIETLLVENRLGVPVFVPAGATFEGETQNRAALFAVVVGPRSGEIPLLVRCIERGQPLVAAKPFLRSDAVLLPSARTGDVDQNRVWGTISGTIRMHQNPTLDYSRGVLETDVVDFLSAIGPALRNQRGYVAAIRSERETFYYADILGSGRLYARLHDKLCRGLTAAAAASRRRGSGAVGRAELLAFLRDAGQVELERRALRSGFVGLVCVGKGSVDVSALVDAGLPIQVSFRREPPRPELDLNADVDPTIFRVPFG